MLRPAWQRLRQAFDRSRQVGGWTAHSLLNPAYALELGLVEAQRRAGHDPSFSRISAQLDAQWRLGLRPGIDARIGTWAEVCGAFGIELLDPTRDQRLVELCWRLPDELFWFHGRQRGLIRSAMRELLPKEVLNCTGKGIQSADLAARLRDCRRDLLAELDRVAGHPLVQAWIDVPRLVSSVQAVLDGSRCQPTGAVDPANLLRSLSAAIFIARQD
jgi:asparagine synthase (glutamine-hydrolysing)